MSNEPLGELRQKLIAAGHSRRYVDRLCDELRDHALSGLEAQAQEGTWPPIDWSETSTRLGTSEVLANCVRHYMPPMTLAARHPDLIQTVLPSVVSVFVLWLNIALTWTLSRTVGMDQCRSWYGGWSTATLAAVGFLVGAVAVWLVGPQPLRQLRLWGVLLIVSATGLVEIQWVGCSAASSGLFRVAWGFDLWRTAMPWAGAAITFLALRFRPSNYTARARGVAVPWWRSMIVTLSMVVLLTSSIPLIRRYTARHPYDPIVQTLNHPLSIAGQRIELLRDKQVQGSLELSASQTHLLTQALADYDRDFAELSRQYQLEGARWRPYDPAWAKRPIEAFIQRQSENLTVEQQRKLDRWLVQRAGTTGLLLTPVVDHLGLTAQQLEAIKDCLLEMQLDRQRCFTRLSGATAELRAALVSSCEQREKALDQEIWSLLTSRQNDRLRELPAVTQWHVVAKHP